MSWAVRVRRWAAASYGPRRRRTVGGKRDAACGNDRTAWRACGHNAPSREGDATQPDAHRAGPAESIQEYRMKTQAAVAWKAGAPLTIETVDLGGPRAGEVLVEVKATGICHTD